MRPEDSIRRDLRRYQLALRLTRHQARTRTISALTQLTRHQLATLRLRWRVPQDIRHRGPAPKSLAVFFRSPRARSEGASLAVLCRLFNAIPQERGRGLSPDSLPLELGERLCVVFEVYRSCFPASDLEFDELLMLALKLARGDEIATGRCASCGGLILIDRLAASRYICSHCHALDGVREPQIQGASAPSEPFSPDGIEPVLL